AFRFRELALCCRYLYLYLQNIRLLKKSFFKAVICRSIYGLYGLQRFFQNFRGLMSHLQLCVCLLSCKCQVLFGALYFKTMSVNLLMGSLSHLHRIQVKEGLLPLGFCEKIRGTGWIVENFGGEVALRYRFLLQLKAESV